MTRKMVVELGCMYFIIERSHEQWYLDKKKRVSRSKRLIKNARITTYKNMPMKRNGHYFDILQTLKENCVANKVHLYAV